MTGPVILGRASRTPLPGILLVPQDMLRGDLDALARVGGHEGPDLLEALAGKVGDGLLTFTAVIISAVGAHEIERPRRHP